MKARKGIAMWKKSSIVTMGLILFLSGVANADLKDQIRDLELRRASLREDLKDADQKIRENDSLLVLEKERFELMASRSKTDLENRTQAMKKLDAKVAEIQGQLRSENFKQARLKDRRAEVDAKRKHLMESLIDQCKSLEATLSKTLPWDLESRVGRVSALRRDLESGSANLEEGFGRLKAVVEEEIKFGDEVVVQSSPMPRNDGTLVNATVLRIGNQWMVYVDDEEKHYGILRKSADGKYSWFENLDFSQREAVRTAIAVKMAKKPPQVVELPLSVQTKGAQ